MSGKYALIIGNTEYSDRGLAKLNAPGKDAGDFARVLRDPNVCAFDKVFMFLNRDVHTVNQAIDDFFTRRKPDDLLLFYFSGHGVRDENGALYLAVKDTNRARLLSTAIRSDFIRGAMDQSRSKRQVLILDCCNSGAFTRGEKSPSTGTMGAAIAFEGKGHVILTATDAIQFALDGDQVIGSGVSNSLFTHFLIKGLEGEADQDGDGKINIDDLYDYAYAQVITTTSKQTPVKWSYSQHGEIILRQSKDIPEIKPQPLPAELNNAIESPLPYVREGAVKQLEEILRGKNARLAQSARESLERIAAQDDSTRVVAAAKQVLGSASKPLQQDTKKDRPSRGQLPKRRNAAWIRPTVLGGTVLLLLLCAMASRSTWYPLVSSLLPEAPFVTQTAAPFVRQPEVSVLTTSVSTPSADIPTQSPEPSTLESTQTISPTNTSILPMSTEKAAPTPDAVSSPSCANAPRRLHVGIEAQVVTESDSLIMRDAPHENAVLVTRLGPGTIVTVVDGPRCGPYNSGFFWWWEVVEPARLRGWVVEGEDERDKIFIRPSVGTQVSSEKDGVTLIYIPPGRFTMGLMPDQVERLRPLCNGIPACEGLLEDSPTYTVELADFWIYKTEVTNANYALCVNAGSCTEPPSRDNEPTYTNSNYYANPNFGSYPVVWVSWTQAQEYCQWAGGDLPTSAQWEYAARGDDGRLFPWGDTFPDPNRANVNSFHGHLRDARDFDEYASPFGLLNMTGNVWEWTLDWYDPGFYPPGTTLIDPLVNSEENSINGSPARVVRGGSAWFVSALASVGVQDWEHPTESNFGIGFRCAQSGP